jgi:hypothetical protein
MQPDAPAEPVTSINSSQVDFSWTPPFDNGSPITGYQVLIRHADGVTFNEDLTYCDGSEASILANSLCSVPINALRALPYNLNWGDSIVIKLSAINAYGASAHSIEGNGAIILTNPDPPINF